MNITTDQENKEIIESVKKIDKKLHDEELSPKERTKLMYEQMLTAIKLTSDPLRFRFY